MVKRHFTKVIIILLIIVSVVFITLNYQNNHKLKSLQMKIDDHLKSSLSDLDHKLSKVDISTFSLNLGTIQQSSSQANALASLSSYNKEQPGISSVARLLESKLINIEGLELKLTEDQLAELKAIVKALAQDPGNINLINELNNLLVVIE